MYTCADQRSFGRLLTAAVVIGLCATRLSTVSAFSFHGTRHNSKVSSLSSQCLQSHKVDLSDECSAESSNRRNLMATATLSLLALTSTASPFAANAADTVTAEAVEMKSFVDPKGLFALNIPKRYYTVRRTAKGDLPDEKTGKGRRGSSIFTAGDLSKAEVIAVERFPARVLLEENGIDPTGTSLATFPEIGDATAIASLITIRREKDKPGNSNTRILPESVKVSPDGKDLFFSLTTEIEVQKPELLMEQLGISQLIRLTTAKATLKSNDGNILAIFASALETDFKGPDGLALQEAVDTFQAVDQTSSALSAS